MESKTKELKRIDVFKNNILNKYNNKKCTNEHNKYNNCILCPNSVKCIISTNA